MVNLYLLTKHGPSHFPVSPLIFGLFEPFLDFLGRMVQKGKKSLAGFAWLHSRLRSQ